MSQKYYEFVLKGKILKISRQFLVEKIIPTRKNMLFILKQLYRVGQFTGDIIAAFIV